MLGVSGARIAKLLIDPRSGRRGARVVAILAGTVAMYAGIVGLAFAFYRYTGVRTETKQYVVTEAVAGFPAAGKFTKGERVVAVNGAPLDRSLSTIVDKLGGAPVRLTVRRGDTTRDVTLHPVGHDGHWMLGLRLAEDSRSYDASLAVQRAFAFPIEQTKQLIPRLDDRPEAAGPVRMLDELPKVVPFGERALRQSLLLATCLLLLVIASDVVRVVRAVRAR